MKAQVLDDDFNEGINQQSVEIINVNKFIILCILTLGLYSIWWMYKAWRFFKEKDFLDVLPVMRAIFSIFFLYALFERIKTYANDNGYTESYSSWGLFILYLGINFLNWLPDPFSFLSVFSFVALLAPFRAFNYSIKSSEDFKAIEADGFNSRQVGLIVFGIVFWGLILLGLFASENI